MTRKWLLALPLVFAILAGCNKSPPGGTTPLAPSKEVPSKTSKGKIVSDEAPPPSKK